MKEHMGSGIEHYRKRAEAAEKIRTAVENVCARFDINAEIIDNPGSSESVTICVKNKQGKIIREFGLMKVEYVPVANHSKKIADVVEALLRFPELDIVNAVQKVEEKTGA